MVQHSRSLWVVFKNTGGRLWNKPWGRKRRTQSQKDTQRQEQTVQAVNRAILKALEAPNAEEAASKLRTERFLPSALRDKILASCHVVSGSGGSSGAGTASKSS